MYVPPRHPPAVAKRIAQRLAAKEHPGMVPENYDTANDTAVRLELVKMSILRSFRKPLTPRERAEDRRRRQLHLARSMAVLDAMIATGKPRNRSKE